MSKSRAEELDHTPLLHGTVLEGLEDGHRSNILRLLLDERDPTDENEVRASLYQRGVSRDAA